MTTHGLHHAVHRDRWVKIAVMVMGTGLVGIADSCAPIDSQHTSPSLSAVSVANGQRAVPNAAAPRSTMGAETKQWLMELACLDSRGLLRTARERCVSEARDFSCVFLKQERIHGTLKEMEEIDVRYRAAPLSVFMVWRRGVDQAKRALFIDQLDFIDANGRRIALVEPAGVLIRLFVSDVRVPIHDARAQEASRRAIDEFGFQGTFEILERVNELAAARNELDFRYEGEGEVDGRATFVFVRRLPYSGHGGRYPDAKTILHLDQEWLLPTGVYSYTDPDGHDLLGSYVYTQVVFSAGFGDDDFRF